MAIERRRAPRIELLGRMHGQIVSLGVPVTVREISLVGLSLETPFPFPEGAVHEFSLTLGDDSVVQLRGQVVHCRESAGPDGASFFVTGVRFVDEELPDGPSEVEGIIKKIR
jgi:hypothetical protein